MKQQIDDLRDYAELAMASYGYWHLMGKKFANKTEYKDRKDTEIVMSDMLDSAYNGYVTSQHITFINTEKLDGEMTPTQVKHFFKKYDLLIHQPNTESNFSATLFQNKQTKDFILAIYFIKDSPK
ncbi:hypothetical protein [Helicobacter sp. T3_23-1056]